MADPADETAARFNDHKRRIDREAFNLEEEKANLEKKYAKAQAEKRRVEAGLPLTDACPDCWVRNGEMNIIVARASPNPDKFDRWGCPKCGWIFDVAFRD